MSFNNPYKNAVEYSRKYHAEHREEGKASWKVWYAKNKHLRAAAMREWRAKNREHHQAYLRTYQGRRYKTDPNFKIAMLLRARLRQALRGTPKAKSTIALAGCTIQFLRGYLEGQFKSGMTWNNIHIDHHIPCSAFDLSDPKQQEQCFHYSNLRPMWPSENMTKGRKRPQS